MSDPTLLLAELNKLRRQYKVLDEERKTVFKKTEELRNMNKETIAKYTSENK